jgi:hypothetical protein
MGFPQPQQKLAEPVFQWAGGKIRIIKGVLECEADVDRVVEFINALRPLLPPASQGSEG